MPFYDMKCTNCGEEFNTMSKMSDMEQKLIKCPKCGSNELERIFGNINIIQSRSKSEPPACPNAHKCDGCCRH